MSSLEYLVLFLVNNLAINYIIALNNIMITLKLITKSLYDSITGKLVNNLDDGHYGNS